MALDWLPIASGAPMRRPRRRPAADVLLTPGVPIPQPPPPTELTWQPRFPDRAQRWRAQRVAPIAWAPLPPIFQLGWLPILPASPIRRRPIRGPQVILGDVGAQVVISTLTAWRTIPTAPIRRRAVRASESRWIVDATTLLNAAPCIELTAETLTPPTLTTEAAVSPALIDETLVSPTLTEEDLC